MNDWDRNNLNFLLSADDRVIKEWSAQVSDDDIDYAHELLARYSEELREQALALKIECQMELDGNYHEANMVIDKFRL